LVELAGLLFEGAYSDFDSGVAEAEDALSGDEGVWVFGGDYAAGDSGFDEGVGAGGGAAVVAAGLEGYVGGCAGCVHSAVDGLFEGCDLGVVEVVVEVGSFGDDLVFFYYDAAYLGVRGGKGDGVGGELEGSLHEAFVLL
jgi:hypothetical protein